MIYTVVLTSGVSLEIEDVLGTVEVRTLDEGGVVTDTRDASSEEVEVYNRWVSRQQAAEVDRQELDLVRALETRMTEIVQNYDSYDAADMRLAVRDLARAVRALVREAL